MVLTILFSVLLTGAQTVFTADVICSAQSVKAKCACAHCEKKTNCCLSPSVPGPNPLSVPPASNASGNPLHLLLAVVSQLLTRPAPLAPASLPQSSFAPKTTDVPLYQWNCSYLV